VADRLTNVLLFDGDCGFCTTTAGLAARIAPALTVVPWQRADLGALGVRAEDAQAAVQWVAADKRIYAGAAATARFLIAAGGGWRFIGRLLLVPGVRRLADLAYRLVAANRHRLPGGTPACRAD
jgi:predicted DCC family thiol-disulfide oxidoreductase YuxK